MTGVLVIGGKAPSSAQIRRLVEKADLVGAADSGFDTLVQAGCRPSFVAGDMDSLECRDDLAEMDSDCIFRYPEDKDDTDTEIGMARLRILGASKIILIGGGEGRLAHSLGLLQLFYRDNPPDLWYTGQEEIRLISGRSEFSVTVGDSISLYPLEETGRLESTGLQWELAGRCWKPGDMGLSNRAICDRVVISIESGRLLMIREPRSKKK